LEILKIACGPSFPFSSDTLEETLEIDPSKNGFTHVLVRPNNYKKRGQVILTSFHKIAGHAKLFKAKGRPGIYWPKPANAVKCRILVHRSSAGFRYQATWLGADGAVVDVQKNDR